MGLPQVGDNDLSNKFVDILIISFYCYSSLWLKVPRNLFMFWILEYEYKFHVLHVLCMTLMKQGYACFERFLFHINGFSLNYMFLILLCILV